MIDLGQMALRLKEARIRKGLSQESVERLTGVSVRTVRRCEIKGTTNVLTIEKLCNAYDVNLYYILEGSTEFARLAEIINSLGPDVSEVLMALCRFTHGSNSDN